MPFPKTFISLILLLCAVEIQSNGFGNFSLGFCWRDTIFRGFGSVPTQCATGHEKIGAFCYPSCPNGYTRFGFDCHQKCPDGWADQGLFCRHVEYGRGVGFPWKLRDGFSFNESFRRCEETHGEGNCEKSGAIVYPKCKKGYHPFGCCICRPEKPNCAALGMGHQVDLSCAKKIVIGDPQLGRCGPDKEMNVGLCYDKCPANYTGVAMVCWSKLPVGWVKCGLGAAANKIACGGVVTTSIVAVGAMALNIATAGAASRVASRVKLASGVTSKAAKLKKLLSAAGNSKYAKFLKKTADPKVLANLKVGLTKMASDPKISSTIKMALQAKNFYMEKLNVPVTVALAGSILFTGSTNADAIRLAGYMASLADPTGIAFTAASFSYPKCSKIHAGDDRSTDESDSDDSDDSDDSENLL